MLVTHSVMGKTNAVPWSARTESEDFQSRSTNLDATVWGPSSTWGHLKYWWLMFERVTRAGVHVKKGHQHHQRKRCDALVWHVVMGDHEASLPKSKDKTSVAFLDGSWYIYECDHDMTACNSRQQTWFLKVHSSHMLLSNPADRNGRHHCLLLLVHNQRQSLNAPLFHREMFQRY